MNQYAVLEDRITVGIEFLSRSIKTVDDKKQLDGNTDRFNKINSDFQENWNDEYWNCYDMLKDGNKKKKGFKPELAVRVAHLQELATTLNKNINDEKKVENAITEEPEIPKEKNRLNNPDPIERKCCSCEIY